LPAIIIHNMFEALMSNDNEREQIFELCDLIRGRVLKFISFLNTVTWKKSTRMLLHTD
jgi:hypothetical protein